MASGTAPDTVLARGAKSCPDRKANGCYVIIRNTTDDPADDAQMTLNGTMASGTTTAPYP
jgi:hypothetical protein